MPEKIIADLNRSQTMIEADDDGTGQLPVDE
jgi:hypothetical protein